MARRIDEATVEGELSTAQEFGGRLDRAAARAFAAAISSLIIATLVVSQSAQALDPEGTIAGNSFEVGTVNLVDDDQGRSLVNLTDMGPGRPVDECIDVKYEGSILPVEIDLAATTVGDLAQYLVVVIEQGSGGRYGSCDDFEKTSTVYTGTLADLALGEPIAIGTIRNQGDDVSFHFRFELLDDERAVGQSASVDFVWEAIPS